MTDRYYNEIDIAEFDRQDGLLPPSLQKIFIPSHDHREETKEPPTVAQALGALSLLVLPIWFDLAAGVL